jgi:hypothetical protein
MRPAASARPPGGRRQSRFRCVCRGVRPRRRPFCGSSPERSRARKLEESKLHEREVDGEEEVAESRARATDGEEAEVVAVAGRWEGLAA